MKKIYLVSARHVSPEYCFDKTEVEVAEHRDGWSASHPKLGYVCDFDTPQAAIRDLFGASACSITEMLQKESPALKPFTKEGRFECGLDDIVKGKVWCFVNVVGENYPARLGVAIANEPGYVPIPEFWCHADDYSELDRHAEELNNAEGIDVREAARIVLSSMRPAPAKRDNVECEHCGGDGIEPAGISFDAGDGEGEDRPCSVCAA
jgi:hypothetical protein